MSTLQKERYIEKIVKLGISDKEARIYLALLQRRELTALEIHELTHVPRSKVYEITQRMILRGICIEKQMGGKKKYQAVEPRRAVKNLIKDYESNLDKKKRLANEFSKMVSPLYNQGMQIMDVLEYVEIIKGLPSIHERFVDLTRNTKKEAVGFVKSPYAHQFQRQKLAEQGNAAFELLKHGVVVKGLYEFPSEEHLEIFIPHMEKWIKAGEKVRMIEQVPIKMYIFDGRYVLMALDNPRHTIYPLTMLVIEHTGLALAVKILFNHLWEKGKDYRVLKSLIRKKARTEL